MIAIFDKKVNKIGVKGLTKTLVCAIIGLKPSVEGDFYHDKRKVPEKRYQKVVFGLLFCFFGVSFQPLWGNPWSYRGK